MEAFPKIGYRDAKKLQELGDLLLELECAKSDGSLQGLRVLDEPMYLRPVVVKLPGDVQGRWQRHAFRYKTGHRVDYPPFEEFAKFIQDLALEKTDPNLVLDVPDDSPPKHHNPRPRRTYRTEITDEQHNPEKSLTYDPTRWCVLHEKPHPLAKCRALRSKPIKERKNLIRKNRICYHCVASTSHLAKDCCSTIKCSECQSEKHLAAMHAGRPTEQKKEEVKDASPENNQNQEGEDKSKCGPPSHGAETTATAKCTELCGIRGMVMLKNKPG